MTEQRREARKTALGVLAGGVLLVAVMVAAGGLAIALSLIQRTTGRGTDLTPWLVLEVLCGGPASLVAGWLSRRVGSSFRSPAILAGLTLGLGAWEATEVLRYAAASGSTVPPWLVWIIPIVGAGGVLLGGMGRDTWRAAWRGWSGAGSRGEWRRLVVPPTILLSAAVVSAAVLPDLDPDLEQDVVAAALTLDFTVALPAAVFWLWVRARRVPWIALIPTIAIGYAVAAATIPQDRHAALEVVRWLVIPAELVFATYLVVVARRAFRHVSGESVDFATKFRATALRVLGTRLPADILTTEVSIFYYGLRTRRTARSGGEWELFTTHRKASYPTVLIAIGMILVVEALALHVLLTQLSSTAAWILTSLSLYGLMWIVGDYRACIARPTIIDDAYLKVRLGLRWEADIPLTQVSDVGLLGLGSKPRPGQARVISILGQPNVRVRLESSVEVLGMYGIRRPCREIWVRVDEPRRFCEALLERGVERARRRSST